MNIIITGASRGIGYQTALQLSEKHQVLAISRDKIGLENLQQSANKLFPNNYLQILDLDIAKNNLDKVWEKIEHWQSLDIIIHNAATLKNQNFEYSTEQDWRETFEINVFAILKLTQNLLPMLKKGQNPHILHIGSMSGFQGSAKFGGLALYGASKAALAGFTEGLAEELKDYKISVNCLALGAVQTEMLAEAFPNYQTNMSSEKMAEFISYFAVNGQHFFNGKILPVSTSTP